MRSTALLITLCAGLTLGAISASAQTQIAPASVPADQATAATPDAALPDRQAATKQQPPLPQSVPAKEDDLSAGAATARHQSPEDQKMIALAKQLAKSLNDQQVAALEVIRDNFGQIRTVQTADADIYNAIQACGKANPDLDKTMSDRFEEWKNALGPVLDKDQKDMAASIDSAIAGPPKSINAYLNAVDKAASAADDKIDKRPVTTAKACKALLASMDRTQATLAGLLDNLKWPDAAMLAHVAPVAAPAK